MAASSRRGSLWHRWLPARLADRAGRSFGAAASPVPRSKSRTDDLMRRALLAILEDDSESAESYLAAAAQLDSKAVDAYLALARLYRSRGEVGRAIRVHQNLLLRTDLEPPDRVVTLAELALDYRQGGFLRRAIASTEEVLVHQPRHREALESLVELLGDAREHHGALAAACRLERLNRRRDPAREAALLVQMARASHGEGRHDAARKAVKRALRRDPENAHAAALLGELEAERGRSKAALAAWRKVPFLESRDISEIYPRLESTFAALGRPRDYEGLLREVLETRPDDSAARLALARNIAARGEVDRSVQEIRELLNRDPKNLDAHIALARLLLAEHRDTDALKAFGELLEVLESSRPLLVGEGFE